MSSVSPFQNKRTKGVEQTRRVDRPSAEEQKMFVLFCLLSEFYFKRGSRGARHGDVPSGSSVPSGLNVYLKSVRNRFMQLL